jgi:hypothetical protein
VFAPDAVTKDKVKAASAGNGAMPTSPAFVEMYGKINVHDSVWGVVNGSSPGIQKLGMPIAFKAMFGSVNVTDGVTVDGRMRLGSPDEATQLVNAGRGQLGQLKAFVDKVELSSEGPDVKLSVAANADQVRNMASMVGAMGGGGGDD